MKYYSIAEAAKLLDMSSTSLGKLVRNGMIPTTSVPGCQVRIHHNDLTVFALKYGYKGFAFIVEPLVTAQGSTADVVKDVRLLLCILKNRPDFDPRSIADVIP